MSDQIKPANVVVWAEIPVTDMERARSFYEAVLQTTLVVQEGGPHPILNFPGGEGGGASGHIYPGTPAKSGGPTVHFAVPDSVEAAAERVKSAGGSTDGQVITIPVGRFAYATDPDDNSIGLFEFAG
ncbi:MAG: VOC family protein [Sulfitobacter sp.]